jgi:hypothetical protein
MKKIYLIIVAIIIANFASAQIEGTWKLAPRAGALAVGPSATDFSWWSSDEQALVDRACLFDDSLKFDASGVVTHYMDNLTWMEEWQGLPSPQCNLPSPPHDGYGDGSGFTYTFDAAAGTLTMNGIGAHLGLAKVINGAELTSPIDAPSSITYNISFSNNNNTMTADIDFGIGWWRFVYDRTTAPAIENPMVTFSVDMSQYVGTITNGVFLNGTFNGWCGDCTPMTNVGNDIWEVSLSIPAGSIQYKFTIDGWNAQEEFGEGLPCIDLIDDGFNNRAYTVTETVTIPTVCFNSCSACEIIVNSTITLNASPTNGGTTSGSGTFENGSSVTVTATANTGFTFLNWTQNGNIVSTSASYTFTLTADITLVANFEMTTNMNVINLSANPTNGGTTSGSGTFENGSSVTVTATANTGFTFLNWTQNGNIVSTSASYTFTLTADITLVANFEMTTNMNVINLSANPTNGGTTSGSGTFENGSSVTVTATANTGFTFLNWTQNGNIVSTSASYTFTLTADITLVANFEMTTNMNVINLSANPTNGGTTSGSGTFENGSSVTVTAMANTGFTFLNWTQNGNIVSTSASYTFTLTADITLVANFDGSSNLGEISNSTSVKIYPNPTNGKVIINLVKNTDFSVEISDLKGSVLMNKSNLTNGSELNLNNLQSGNYLIKIIQDNDEVVIRKIIIE